MKIESVKIENFRCFKDETIFFDNYTCFVGSNGAGKSTVFHALNIFFRQYKDSQTDLSKLKSDDFHHKNTSNEIRITVTFKDLRPEAETELSNYVRHNKLVVTAVAKYDPVTETAEVKQYGNRLVMPAFRPFFEAEKKGAKVPELQSIFAEIRSIYSDVKDEKTKANMISSLNEYEENHIEECELTASEDEFYGVTKGVNRLAPFVQWVFIPASKDLSEEGEESKTSALGQLLARTVRSVVSFDDKVIELRKDARDKYQALLDAEQSSLDTISSSLQEKLSSWAHPNIKARVMWKQDPEKSIKIEEPGAYIKIGERGFESELARFGHGLQRSYMLALLQELALVGIKDAPTLIMGIEEPELYQHPPQARHLAETLIDLSEKDSQVMLCTHSPLFIPGDNFDKIRIVRESGNPSLTSVRQLAYSDLMTELKTVGQDIKKEAGMVAKLYPSLKPIINEMFFCKNLVLVEGDEDVAYITSYLILSGKILEFRKYGGHIVPVAKKSEMIKPLVMANLLKIPTYVIFDCDTNKTKVEEINLHKKDNKSLLTLKKYSTENEWPVDDIIKSDLTAWKTNIGDTLKSEFGTNWDPQVLIVETYYGQPGGLEKNPLAIARLMENFWNLGKKSTKLIDLVDRLIEFGKTNC